MAVIASGLFGMISGSCVANVVSTGAFTIPLMKRNGYQSKFAGAVEAVASTGGQIMPPIMGAAAFVLADATGTPYSVVCIAAILPAIMYYVCLFKMVDLEAVKHDLSGLPPEMIPDLGTSVRKGVKLFVPIILLLVLMLGVGTTPMVAAIWSIAANIICSFLDKNDRMTFSDVIEGAVSAGRSLCTVVGACATAGIVVAVFSLTGLGLKFSNFIVQLGGNMLIPSLVLSMIVCAILGMGLPTTAAYIVCATAITPTIAPCLVRLVRLYMLPKLLVKLEARMNRMMMMTLSVNSVRLKMELSAFPELFLLDAIGFPPYVCFAFSAFDGSLAQHFLFRQRFQRFLVKFRGDVALRHDDQAIGQPHDLRQIGRNHDNALALFGQLFNEFVDFFLRAHVDADGLTSP